MNNFGWAAGQLFESNQLQRQQAVKQKGVLHFDCDSVELQFYQALVKASLAITVPNPAAYEREMFKSLFAMRNYHG